MYGSQEIRRTMFTGLWMRVPRGAARASRPLPDNLASKGLAFPPRTLLPRPGPTTPATTSPARSGRRLRTSRSRRSMREHLTRPTRSWARSRPVWPSTTRAASSPAHRPPPAPGPSPSGPPTPWVPTIGPSGTRSARCRRSRTRPETTRTGPSAPRSHRSRSRPPRARPPRPTRQRASRTGSTSTPGRASSRERRPRTAWA